MVGARVGALLSAAVAICVTVQADVSAQGQQQLVKTWKAAEFYQASTSRGVMLRGKEVTLDDQVLIEDDSPGCGYSSEEKSVEILSQGVLLKKTLLVETLPVRDAFVVAMIYPDNPPEPNNGRHLVFTVNGKDFPYEVNHFWTSARISSSALRKGENTIIVRTKEPDARFRTSIALDENYRYGSTDRVHHPNRSARSTDNGKTWDDQHLGVQGTADGEYSIRLKLSAYRPEGWLESPVIDLVENSNLNIISQPVEVQSVQLNVRSSSPRGTRVRVQFRSGPAPDCESRAWSEWEESPTGVIGKADIQDRFFQFRIVLSSQSPRESPTLLGVVLKSTYELKNDGLLGQFRVLASRSFPKIRSSLGFEYENPHAARLRELREKVKLDEVVKGATTEFEKVLRLKHWIAGQWEWHLLKPNEDIIEWDAVKILTPDSTGKVYGGFCLHYAIVMMQVLQSFGISARVVSVDYSVWGGHEVTEMWSSDFGKWICLDANFDTYFVDKRTGIPMSALEMHRFLLTEYFAGEKLDRDKWVRRNLVKRVARRGADLPVIGMVGGGANAGRLKQYEWWNPPVDLSAYCGGYGPLVMGYLRYMPRSNYLSKPHPIPINHGRTHWGWTGYYCWYDDQTPQSKEHALFTNREADLYWNLNQVGISAEATPGGIMKLFLDTNSPDFDHYEVTVNGERRSLHESAFDMVPQRGLNRINVRVVDSMGNQGTESFLEYVYLPKGEQN